MDDSGTSEPIELRRVLALGLWTTMLGLAFTLLLISDTVSATTF